MDRVKLFSGGATGVEAKVNEWMGSEGAGAEIKSIHTCAFGTQKGDEPPVHTVIVTIWYEASR